MGFMGNFAESRRVVENEGVYIGGWSIKNAFVPDRTRGTNLHSDPATPHVAKGDKTGLLSQAFELETWTDRGIRLGEN